METGKFQNTINTIEPTNAMMLKLYFSHTIYQCADMNNITIPITQRAVTIDSNRHRSYEIMHVFKYSSQAISMSKLCSVQGTEWGREYNGTLSLQDYTAQVVGE